jgi:hypothetical protein
MRRLVSSWALVLVSLLLVNSSVQAAGPTSPARSARPAHLLAVKAAGRTETGTPEQQAAVRTSREAALLPLQTACPVVPAKELFITDVSVVDDCVRTTWTGVCLGTPVLPATRGAWTVGGLLPGIFGTTNAATLSTETLRWLNQWMTARTVNGDVIPARTFMKTLVIDPWLAASGGVQLDMKKAPFRLLAIVNRIDLRQNAGYSGGTSAGEGRFVFNVLDIRNNPPTSTQFNVIFEYGLDAANCTDVLNWAHAWHGLGALAFGPNYNAALETITDRFTAIGASPAKPNGSAINQVRTNEIALAAPWELREFHLARVVVGPAGPAQLLQATVAQTPARSLQGGTAVAGFVNANAPAILANNYVVPLSFGGAPFRGGAAPNSLDLNWDGSPTLCGTNPAARAVFSLNTCNGCHGAEVNIIFKQVEPRNPGVPAALSAFLTGEGPLTDMCGLSHNFNDIERRRVDLCQLLQKSCAQIDAEPVITFVH